MCVVAETATNLRGVVTQKKVDGFTHFGDGIAQGFTGFAHDQTHQRLHFGFHQIGCAFQQSGARGGRRGLPDGPGVLGAGEGAGDVIDRGFNHIPHHIAVVGRIAHRLFLSGAPIRRRGQPDMVGEQRGR